MLCWLLHVLLLICGSAMALKPRDAIHVDDLDRYDLFMKELDSAPDHFLDMYMHNRMVKVDVYQHPTNVLARSELFTPSPTAQEFFTQEKKTADEMFGEAEGSKECASTENKEEILDPEKPYQCGQSCNSDAQCRRNNGCSECYIVRNGCLLRKLCR